jgi:signal transduction histidine kinase
MQSVDSEVEPDPSGTFLSGGGEMAARMRRFDWSKTPLGPVERWPQSLKTAVRIMLTSRQPMWLGWGEQLIKLYNDAYKTIVGGKHPEALGQPADLVWREIWDEIGPMLKTAMGGIEGTYVESQLLIMERSGYPEETYYTFSYSPIPNDQGGTGGIICANTDDTQRVLGERRLNTLRELAAETAEAKTIEEACKLSASVMSRNLYDLPFTLLYLLDAEGKGAHLKGATGLERATPVSPLHINVTRPSDTPGAWPLGLVPDADDSILLTDLTARFGNLPGGPWPESSHSAMVLAITQPGQATPIGFLIAGISPRRALDDSYKGFLELVAGQVATAIAGARAYEAERKRADALAELDRTKTEFFSNVSHEFRTPLTLMLGPLEDALSRKLDPEEREELEVVHRNGLRLLKLVNTLLDFSRIEAGRIQAVYEPTDLARYTADLASMFHSAIERVGMRLVVDCPPLPQHAYVDREMWEKIVLNLLSNAFKFTFEGTISVSIRHGEGHVELSVTDTGMGIAADELPRLFERFHRIEGAHGRTHEGSGIGLALVQQLVKLHGGTVKVTSEPGRGSAFVVRVPSGLAHLPADRIGRERALPSTATGATAYVEEALRWLPDADVPQAARSQDGLIAKPLNQAGAGNDRPRILLADDNTDMREYVRKLLAPTYEVDAVADGEAALAAALESAPDLILTDVMMPRLDGFGLLRALRSDDRTATIPIILLSARAGEDAKVQGLEAGADDYLIKPFSSRELLARVGAHLEIARARRDADAAVRASEAQLQTLLDEAPLGIYLIDADFRVRQMNPAALPAFEGVSDLVGRDFEEVVHILRPKLYADEIVRLFRHTLETGEPFVTPEQMQDLIDRGVPEYYEWQINRIPLPDGTHGVVCYFRDISARVLARREREKLLAAEREAREAADAASRAKDEFLATVSHELRTPLNAILGWARLVSGGSLSEETAARGLKSIEQNAKAQAQLIEDLLDVSRIISGKFRLNNQPIQVARSIEAAIDSVRPTAEAKGVKLQVTLDPEAGLVSGDAGRLQQVVWNLISNAVKFTPRDGQVQVRLSRKGSEVEIVVTDTGQGIASELLPYVFDRFWQADGSSTRPHSGLGLGLAIVRHITELHGGSVAVDSPGQGQGATFTVRLPILAVRAKSGDDKRLHSSQNAEVASLEFKESLSLEAVKILIVDDEPETLLLLSTLLTHCGAYVKTASSAEEGFRELQTWRPNVIVSDIAMPGEDGYSFMKRVKIWMREAGTWIPAVALTAYARAEDRMKALSSGYQIHVPKPVEPAELIAVITSLVERPTTPWSAASDR